MSTAPGRRRRSPAAALATVIIVLAGALLSGCTSSTPAVVGPDGLTHVVFGTLPIAGTAAVEIAQRQGFFAEQGLDVQMHNAVQTANIAPDLVSGKIHFGFMNAGAVAAAVGNNWPIQAIAPLYYSNGEQGIYVRDDSPIRTVSDLAGKRVALGSLKGNNHAGVLEQLLYAGVDPATVRFTLLPISDTAAAVTSSRVDAAQVQEPNVSKEGARLRVVIPDQFRPFGAHSVVSYVVISRDWGRANPGLVARFLTAYNRASMAAAGNDQLVRATVGAFTEVAPALLEQMALPGFGTDMKIDSFDAQVEAMAAMGFLRNVPDDSEVFGRVD